MINENASQVLWQKYSKGSIAIFPLSKSKGAAYKALRSGESTETILEMLECDPEYCRRQGKHGLKYARVTRGLAFRGALMQYSEDLIRISRRKYTWQCSQERKPKPVIQDPVLLDTENAEAVKGERLARLLNRRSWFDVLGELLAIALIGTAVLSLCIGWALQATHSPLCQKPIQPLLSTVCDMGESWLQHISP